MRTRYLCWAVTLALFLLPLLPATAAPAGPSPVLTTLSPGAVREISQDLTVNVVFVGYEPGPGPRDINEVAFRANLPQTYRSRNRFPPFYGIDSPTGLVFNFDYHLVYADNAFEDTFFAYLTSIAQARPRTFFQNLYNAQPAGSFDVGQNHWIDAPSVEQWLADHAGPLAGVDTTQYTIFFVNWFGRPDFKFHVYTKTDEPDPDTGFNHGLLRDTRKLIAWGGTTPDDAESGLGSLHRLWFYDLSAGPEAWTTNWNLGNADLDGDGVLDYRMPPVWEYGNLAGYRPFTNLSGDLGLVTRYVAIDLLFTASPLYKPALSPPRLPANLQLDLTLYQGDPAVNANAFLNPGYLVNKVSRLQPLNSFSAEVRDAAFSGRAADIYRCWRTALFDPFFLGDSCYGNRLFGIAFADVFLYHQDHLSQFLEGDGDYEVPIFIYNTTNTLAPTFLGYADDNWVDGTQSFIFVFDWPAARNAGMGITTTTIHEVGHHLGLSHPHDGYDSESDVDFFQSGPYYFAWSGDESNTVMSYLAINDDFSQFDRDTMNRLLTSVYINQANAVLARVVASPRVGQVGGLLASADQDAANALAVYQAMDYAAAAAQARQAYYKVLEAAAQINVPVEPQAWPADYRAKGRSSKFVDSVNGYRLNEP